MPAIQYVIHNYVVTCSFNILPAVCLSTHGHDGDAEIARTDITRPDNAASDQTEVLEHG